MSSKPMNDTLRSRIYSLALAGLLAHGCSSPAVPVAKPEPRPVASAVPVPQPPPAPQPEAPSIEQSGQARDATLIDETGVEVSLAEIWSDAPAVVYFYRGHWCEYCQMQLRELQDESRELVAGGINIVAISSDNAAGVEKTKKDLGVTFRLYRDPTRSAIKAWGVYDAKNNIAKPSTFLIDEGGEIVFHHTGSRPDADKILSLLGPPKPKPAK